MDPLISVIVPVYKVEAYLERCLASLVKQTYHNLEIILVDDGSPDRCPALCDEWAKRDKRIQVIHKKNGGLSDARNAGLVVAKGKYIAFVDSDDWIHEAFIETLYGEILENNSEIAECGVSIIEENGSIQRIRSCEGECMTLNRTEALRRLVLEQGVYQTVWNKLYKAESIKGILFKVGKCHEDDFWTYQVLENVDTMTVISKPLYSYLQRCGSIMGSGYSVKRLDGLEARVHRMQKLGEDPELKTLVEYRIWFDYMYHYQCALRYLKGEERSFVLQTVKDYMMKTPKMFYDNEVINLKQIIWIFSFSRFPTLIAQIRNALKIGV